MSITIRNFFLSDVNDNDNDVLCYVFFVEQATLEVFLQLGYNYDSDDQPIC